MTEYDSLIFSAAGAFVSLPRPGREDAERLDALAIPLFEKLSVEGKRRIAAVLSECRAVIPEQLVEALILQPLDISASLLISRAEIPDAMLEKAIKLGGEPHAKSIALKHNISSAVKLRIDTFIEGITPMSDVQLNPNFSKFMAFQEAEKMSPAQTELELAQARLRNMMMRKTLPETKPVDRLATLPFNKGAEPNIVARFINLALDLDPGFLATALADELSVPFKALESLVQRNALQSLTTLLKGLGFGATDTYAIVAAFNPSALTSREAIASFYIKYQAINDAEIEAMTASIKSAAASGRISKIEAA